MHSTISRRTFARIAGAGVALLGAPPLTLPLRAGNTGDPTTAPAIDTYVRLNSNENPYGPSPAAVKAMTDAFRVVWRYPDEQADFLIADIAKLHGVSVDSVVLGDGSSEILKLAANAFLSPSHKLVTADPTFEALSFYANATHVDAVKVPLDATYAHDLAKMSDAARDAGIVYICNPNNPTATITPKERLRAFIESAPASTIVLVDEAYHHYAESPDYESAIPLVAKHPNLIVSRTFSKIYGMAGLRCGYAIAQPATVEKMINQGVWDSINVMAIVGARAGLADTAYTDLGRKRNREMRAWITSEMKSLGYAALPSQANFVMFDVKRDVKALGTAMKAKGVEVGRLFPAMPQHLRLTVGKPEEMKAFLNAFKSVAQA